jgi:hypothetical protein
MSLKLCRQDAARLALAAVLAAAAVALAVWPHELGHASVAYLYGCKADPWRTAVRWALAGSQGGDIDGACLARRGGGALGFMAFAGIAVNLLLVLLAPLLGRWRRTAGTGFLFTLLWALANAAEALSYLVLNAVWPAADMRLVIDAAGVGRWPWLGGGIVLAVVIARALRAPLAKAAEAFASPGVAAAFWRAALAAYPFAVGAAAVASRLAVDRAG